MAQKSQNTQFIDIMDELSEMMLKNNDVFRARAYKKAQETIMNYPHDIIDPSQLKGLPGIGTTIMDKLIEYFTTGTLKLLEIERNKPQHIFCDIYGVGPKKAQELVEHGIYSIEQLKEPNNQKLLNDIQRVGLKYYEDILKRIPRLEIEKYKKYFSHYFKFIEKREKNEKDEMFEIVGSYRRNAETSGDIDVILKNCDFKEFIDFFISKNIIIEVLSRGPTKCLVIAKLPNSATYRRVDFLYTSEEEFPFAILYFTGSKYFNTVMRQHALNIGYTMNEHNLCHFIKNDDKKREKGIKGSKVNHSFKTEQDIFNYLNLEYKEPHERIDGRSVVFLSKQNLKESKESKEVAEKEKQSNSISISFILKNMRENGSQQILSSLSIQNLSFILLEANKYYYNHQPIMTDTEYDIIKNFAEKINVPIIAEIGAPVERNKAILPFTMASMDKIKPDTGALEEWTNKYKGEYVISCKLDGVSGLYTTSGLNGPRLYTRGDGKIGQDISHFIPYFLPTYSHNLHNLHNSYNGNLTIRGEFIIPKKVFKEKYSTKFANARNMVAGIINSKTIQEEYIKDIHFVIYEVIEPVELSPCNQMKFLSKLNLNILKEKQNENEKQKEIKIVLHQLQSNKLTNKLLSDYLLEWRKNSEYEIDGIIVTHNAIYERTDGNPKHAFAFKMVLSDQIAEATVVDVLWSPSKDGYLKPRVQIEPIHLGGVCIEYATGFNAAFIKDNKIGVGAIIEIIRSGDVIPHIRRVCIPAEVAKMPTTIEYIWNATGVDIILSKIEMDKDETVREKNITGFFKGIGVESLSSGNVTKIIAAGFDSISAIIKMNINDFLKVEGFQIKMATKLFENIKERIQKASIVSLMSASNLFGRGFNEKKINLIMENYPNILLTKELKETKINKIAEIKGMAKKSAELFVENIPTFLNFIEELKLGEKLIVITPKQPLPHSVSSINVVISGFRDSELETTLVQNLNARIATTVTKNTNFVIVKDKNDDTKKIIDAKKLGIPLYNIFEFKEKYASI